VSSDKTSKLFSLQPGSSCVPSNFMDFLFLIQYLYGLVGELIVYYETSSILGYNDIYHHIFFINYKLYRIVFRFFNSSNN